MSQEFFLGHQLRIPTLQTRSILSPARPQDVPCTAHPLGLTSLCSTFFLKLFFFFPAYSSGKWETKCPLMECLLWHGPDHPDQLELNLRFMTLQTDLGMSSRMSDNYVYLIIILKPLPKLEHQSHSHNTHCVYMQVSLRHVCDLMPTSMSHDQASPPKYSSQP